VVSIPTWGYADHAVIGALNVAKEQEGGHRAKKESEFSKYFLIAGS
jgi:hypothetical protein